MSAAGDRRRGASILVVEDTRMVAHLLADVLERAGYEVESVADGTRALARMLAQPPELVVLDLILPELSGLELLRVMKQVPALAALPVIAVSSQGQPAMVQAALDAGAAAFLAKPFSPAALTAKVDELVGSRRGDR